MFDTKMSVKDSTHKDVSAGFYTATGADARLTQEAAKVSVQDSTQQQQPLVFDTWVSVQDSTHEDVSAGFHTQGCQCRILHCNSSRCVFNTRMSMQDSTQGCWCRILHSNRSRCAFDTGRCEGVRAGLSDGTAEVLAEAEEEEELDGVVAVGPVQQN